MTGSIQPNPHDLRVEARTMNYPNRLVEDDQIKTVDEAVLDKVRIYEAQLVGNARELLEDKQVHEAAATDLIQALTTELRHPLMDGERPSAALAARYEKLRGLAQIAMNELARAETDAAWLEEKCASPYEALVALWEKWPTIRPTLR